MRSNGFRKEDIALSHGSSMAIGRKSLSRLVFMKVKIILFIDTEKGDFSFLKDDVWWLRV